MTRLQIAHASYTVEIHCNGDNTRLWIDFDVVGMYGTVLIVLALDEQNVRLQ